MSDPLTRGVVDVSADSEDDIAEVVDIINDSDDQASFRVRSGAPPMRFHGYRRGRELGRGATGKVFLCQKKGCNTGFAVKAVDLRRIQLSSNAEREHTALCREVEILKTLPPHPNIVQMIDAFEEGDWFLIILELVGGGDLYTVLTAREQPRLLEREAAFVLRQLACGLTFLHGQGVIHRDLKLENVLIASECRERNMVLYSVKITDFGLSKAIGSGVSEAYSLVGTRPYTAPEVLSGGSYDFSSDLWCLGVILYILLAGRFPFNDIPEDQLDLEVLVEGLAASEVARCLVISLLQLEPAQRLSLEALSAHEWLQDEVGPDRLDRPLKRQRTSKDGLSPRPSLEGSPAAAGVAASPAPSTGGASALGDAATPVAATTPLACILGSPSEDAFAASLGLLGPSSPLPPESPKVVLSQDFPETPLASEFLAAATPTATAVSATLFPSMAAATAAEATTPGATQQSGDGFDGVNVDPADVWARSSRPDVMQVHMTVPDGFAEAIHGKAGVQMKQVASTVGCKVRTTARDRTSNHKVIISGNYPQCALVQELVRSRLAEALRAEGQELPDLAEVVLFVRAEAAGVVTGKQQFKLRQIRKESGAEIQLQPETIKGQRPCVLRGSFISILRAERHVFDLVRAVPVVAKEVGPDLPRTRISMEPVIGDVLFWKGHFGWIQPAEEIDHPQAVERDGHIYVHQKDVTQGCPLKVGQRVTFHVYSDFLGLGAEECSIV